MSHTNKILYVFDFDDTLCDSEAHNVRILHENGQKTTIEGHKWSLYQPQEGDIFDFSDFATLKNPRKITQVWKIYEKSIKENGNENTWICTARKLPDPLVVWLTENHIKNPQIACMAIPPGQNNGLYKSAFIKGILHKIPYEEVYFFDDRTDCVEEVFELKKTFPTVKFTVGKVKGPKIQYLKG